MKKFEAPGTGKILLLDDISSAMFKFPRKTIIIIETIEDYVNMALIQHRRIFIDLEQIKGGFTPKLGPHGIPGQPILASGKALTTILFGDIFEESIKIFNIFFYKIKRLSYFFYFPGF